MKVTNAFMIASDIHQGEPRKYNGNPYITHPVRVALSVSSYPLVRLPMACAAFLHDTREDLPKTITMEQLDARIKRECGEETLSLVVDLTNVKIHKDGRRLPRREQKKNDWERLSKVCKEAKIIKMLDRIDNLQEMTNALPGFKRLYVEETLEGLLPAVKDGDADIAFQLEMTAKRIFEWQYFPLDELRTKPPGTIFEYHKGMVDFWQRKQDEVGTAECWIEYMEKTPGMRFGDNSWKSFDCNPEEWHIILRETGASK